MLPKVATHILHTTSRVAAQAVQAPLRNVLHTGSTNGSNIGNWNGTGSSNWGGHGTGTGSTKQNTGSRYYSSFNTAGRAVSQANAVSANDGSFAQSDENDDHLPRRVVVIQSGSGSSSSKRPRIRSSSVSLTKAESIGVLKTLQLQGRTRFLHTSIEGAPQLQSITPVTPSRPRRNSTSSSDGLDRPTSPVRNFSDTAVDSGTQTLPESPARPRRNSISSVGDLDASAIEVTDPALEQIDQVIRSRRNSASSAEESQQSEQSSVDTKPTTPPTSPLTSEQPAPSSPRVSRPTTPAPSSRFSYLNEARDSKDPHHVAEAVARFRSEAKGASTKDFNVALEALLVTRQFESAMPMLEVYNDMIKYSVHPNALTYNFLLTSLTARDQEVANILASAQALKSHAEIFGEHQRTNLSTVRNQLDILYLEQRENFASLASLFSISKGTVDALPIDIYVGILRACRHNSNIDIATQVFDHAQQVFGKLQPQFYEHMIQIYGHKQDIQSAENIFRSYVDAGRQEKILPEQSATEGAKHHILVWNAMIDAYFKCGYPDKAVEGLDRMIRTPAGLSVSYAAAPLPSASTYTSIIRGFCANGDVSSAIRWYERLETQGIDLDHPYTPSNQPIRPHPKASRALLDALGMRGMATEINKLFPTIRLKDNMHRVPHQVYSTNMRALANVSDPAKAKEILDFVVEKVLPRMKPSFDQNIALSVALQYLNRGFLEESIGFMAEYFNRVLAEVENPDTTSPANTMMDLRRVFYSFADAYFRITTRHEFTTPEGAASMLYMACASGLSFAPPFMHMHMLHVYATAKTSDRFPVERITSVGWQELLRMAVNTEFSATSSPGEFAEIPDYAFGGVFSLVEDLARYQVDVSTFPEALMERTISQLVSVYGPHVVIGAFEQFGPAFKQVIDSSPTIRTLVFGEAVEEAATTSPVHTQKIIENRQALYVDNKQTKIIDDILLRQSNVRTQVMAAYDAFQTGLTKRKIPALRSLGKLIQGLGRQGEVQKVHECYEVAQVAYKSLQVAGAGLHDGWVCIEDSMIIALAHAGDIDNAHVHRMRLIDQGAAPSADAYGALILYVKDTTDDAANGLMLFREAQAANIPMNIYLYNNIISKLAKARKADYALELFHQMKSQGINPTSITYGALIGACARVGDVQSSEALFKEMVEQKNFRPRVPPYNTMMQLYTMTKPNRERALWFYEQLVQAGVQHTSHTYKLLLDAYGSIEPIDITSMEKVFQDLQNDPNVKVAGTHYASLINAYGCVQRDLDKAIAIFDSVPPPPNGPLDAVVFESIINVFVSHRRTDLIPEYISKMTSAGVHMTAYIANFLIKGYAINGELDKAREIFESLIDPPTGVAAPNNHAPHDPSVGGLVGWMEPVYREPSTWEAMVRAELGAGHRDRALELLERLKARQYPEAVYNRIGGVMVDHSAVLA